MADLHDKAWRPWPCGPDHDPAAVREAQEAVLVALDAVSVAYGCDDPRALAYLELYEECSGCWQPAVPREPAPKGRRWHRVSSVGPVCCEGGDEAIFYLTSLVTFHPKIMRLPRSIASHVDVSVLVGGRPYGGTIGNEWRMSGTPFGAIGGAEIDMEVMPAQMQIEVRIRNRTARALERVEVSFDGWAAQPGEPYPRDDDDDSHRPWLRFGPGAHE